MKQVGPVTGHTIFDPAIHKCYLLISRFDYDHHNRRPVRLTVTHSYKASRARLGDIRIPLSGVLKDIQIDIVTEVILVSLMAQYVLINFVLPSFCAELLIFQIIHRFDIQPCSLFLSESRQELIRL